MAKRTRSTAQKKQPAQKPEHPGTGWFTRAEMIAMFNISATQFDKKYKPLAPAEGVFDGRVCKYFHGRKLLDAWLNDELSKHKPKAIVDEDGDALDLSKMAHGDRLIKAKAEREELKLQREREESVDRKAIHDLLTGIARYLRGSMESLQRRYGNEAAEIVSDALDQVEEEVNQTLNEELA